MSDKIGVLGEATTATAATTTVYTVPSGKAARCKIMWAGASHGSTATGDLTITVNGINVAVILNMTAARFLHSNSTLLVNPETAAAPTGANEHAGSWYRNRRLRIILWLGHLTII